MAISTDFTPTLAHWKKELNVTYPVLSDHMRKVSESYGILIKDLGVANRVTFVVDKDGKIAPGTIQVVHSLGLGLDEQAIKAVSQWRFKPGTKDGKPVAVQAAISVNFRLL